MPHAEPKCPECAGRMWNQTKSKFWDEAKNRPMWKCQDKACTGAIWKDDKQWGLEGSELKAPVTRTEAGPGKGDLPGSHEEAPPVDHPTDGVTQADIDSYLSVLDRVGSGWAKIAENWPEYLLPNSIAVQAAAATISIGANRRGGR